MNKKVFCLQFKEAAFVLSNMNFPVVKKKAEVKEIK